MADGRGGARPNSGRKKKQITILRELALEHAEGEAEKSLAFVIAVRNNKKNPIGARLAAAVDVMDRVWGKAKQRVEATGKNGTPLSPPSMDLRGVDVELLRKIVEGGL